jgi:PKD repeat protein
VSGGRLSTTVPAASITLFVIPVKASTNQPPVARITATPSTGSAPLLVSFNGSTSTDSDGTIASYAWNFGDGQQGSGATVTHSYAQPGNYTATLTVKDSGGASTSATVAITVTTTSTSLDAPTNFYAVASGSDVTMRWKDNSEDEEGFILERAEETWPLEFVIIGRTGANATVFVDSDVPVGEYVYRVRAFSGTSVSAYSNQDGADVQ